MPRGAKKDIYATAEARAINSILDVESFITTTGHLRLERGGVDIGITRKAVMERDNWTCQLCGAKVSDDYFETHPLKAEMHHIKNKTWERCDCMHNLMAVCHRCHSKRHNNA